MNKNATSFLFSFKEIRGIALDPRNKEEVMQPLGVARNCLSVDYYFNSSLIFYGDDRTNKISQVSRVGTARKDVITSGLRRPRGLAVDWVAGNLFWTDSLNDVIEVLVISVLCAVVSFVALIVSIASIRSHQHPFFTTFPSLSSQVSRLDGSYRTVVITDLSSPRSIAVYPAKGLVFWADSVGRDRMKKNCCKVERAAMDGTGRQSLVQRSDVWRALGITLDYTEDKVYWLEDSRWILWKMDLDGGKTIFIRQCEFTSNSIKTEAFFS